MAKHTPGPWRLAPVADYTESALHVDAGMRGYICRAGHYGDAAAEANAHLIAAAPDLLAALKGCRDMLLAMAHSKGVAFECLGPAHDAIAKAEGGQ